MQAILLFLEITPSIYFIFANILDNFIPLQKKYNKVSINMWSKFKYFQYFDYLIHKFYWHANFFARFAKASYVANISSHNPVIKCPSIGIYFQDNLYLLECKKLSCRKPVPGKSKNKAAKNKNWFTVIDVLFVSHTWWTQEVGPPSLWF